jgi:hypothetical protein
MACCKPAVASGYHGYWGGDEGGSGTSPAATLTAACAASVAARGLFFANTCPAPFKCGLSEQRSGGGQAVVCLSALRGHVWGGYKLLQCVACKLRKSKQCPSQHDFLSLIHASFIRGSGSLQSKGRSCLL